MTEIAAPASPDRSLLVEDQIFRFLKEHRVEDLGTMMLECVRPLAFMGQQALLIGEPFLRAMVSGQTVKDWQEFLSDRQHVERLIHRLEETRA